jgi:hypothetical protein
MAIGPETADVVLPSEAVPLKESKVDSHGKKFSGDLEASLANEESRSRVTFLGLPPQASYWF